MPSDNQLFQQLPSTTNLLEKKFIQHLITLYSRQTVLFAIQEYLDTLRTDIKKELLSKKEITKRLSLMESDLCSNLNKHLSPSLHKVVNASGVIIHTNIGRAPLAQSAAEAIQNISTGYSNLEYNLETRKRGHRDLHIEKRITQLLKAEAATVCNNNAAAVLLILNTLSSGKKVLVSRGEMVEIGGSFRIPAIMEKSGAILHEVGTTNKTKISDYQEAIQEDTALILRVHPSNYKILGFTQRPALEELAELAHRTGIPLVEDLGSGLLFSSPLPWLKQEPTAESSLSIGVDLICFSGDKLLGGPQSGIIVGKKQLVNLIRNNPLMRACRADKITSSALEWTLIEYEKGSYLSSIPVQKMLTTETQEIRRRTEKIKSLLNKDIFHVEIKEGYSLIGGGSAPEEKIPTYLLTITSKLHSVNELEQHLRNAPIPIISRIENDQLILDLRTVFPEQENIIISSFSEMTSSL